MLDLTGQVRRYNQKNPLIRNGLVAANPKLAKQMLVVHGACPECGGLLWIGAQIPLAKV